VKDLLAYLRLALNPYDSMSLARVINVPARGIGQKTLEELARWAADRRAPQYTALQLLAQIEKGESTDRHPFAPRTAAALIRFLSMLDRMIEAAQSLRVSQLLGLVLEETDYKGYLERDAADEAEERWENIQELVSVARQYDELEGSTALAAFLEDVSLVSDTDEVDERVDAVTLITLHAAKGLEFPVVFIVGLEEGVLPHIRSFDHPEQMEEERRLCYVGLTRARERLYLARAFRRTIWGSSQHNPPSRFLKDIPDDVRLLHTPAPAESPVGLSRLRPNLAAASAFAAQPPSTGPVPVPDQIAFTDGQHVRHPKFGEGIVVSCLQKGGDQEVTVAFTGGAGIKKLLLSFANLEAVS
jgi:DNA helicase-2/ATP-dependent DNA helicase PcrA